MTSETMTFPLSRASEDQTPAQHHPDRWVLHRAGIINVWYYYDSTFQISGGRLILRGTNGSGKSRALEMLFPYLFDAERRRMDATGSGRVLLSDLMKAGSQGTANRVGYLWAELRRPFEADETRVAAAPEGSPSAVGDEDGYAYLTIGAHLRYSRSTGEVKPSFFTTPLRVGHEIRLISQTRDPLSRDQLTELVGADRITVSPQEHRARVAHTVFGLNGERAVERYDGLLQLLHTLRSPDVGNRIEEGRLPQILADALPPLSEQALDAAGEKLDALTETRNGQQRLRESLERVEAFLEVYRSYAAAQVAGVAMEASAAADASIRAVREADERHQRHEELKEKKAGVESDLQELEDTVSELGSTIAGIKESKEFENLKDLQERALRVDAQRETAVSLLMAAAAARRNEALAVERADAKADEVVGEARRLSQALTRARIAVADTGAPEGTVRGLPGDVLVTVTASPAETAAVRTAVDGDPRPQTRPAVRSLTTAPTDLEGVAERIQGVRDVVELRAGQAEQRAQIARQLERDHGGVVGAVAKAEEKVAGAEQLRAEAADRAADHLAAVDEYVVGWRDWLARPEVADVVDRSDELEAVLAQPDSLAGAPVDLLDRLDEAAQNLAAPVQAERNRRIGALDVANIADRDRDRQLADEQNRLEGADDPEPEPARGQVSVPVGAVPLFRAVDFAPGLEADARAGVEGALTASGLLTASVSPDGLLRVADGQLLVTTQGSPVTTRSAAEVLRPDATAGISSDLVDAILSRIGVLDLDETEGGGEVVGAAGVWIAADGRWGAGPLTGRHRPRAAQYVGAAAREATRAARLEWIEAERGRLAAAVSERGAVQSDLKSRIDTLATAVMAAPRSRPIATSHRLAKDAEARAGRAAGEAEDARLDADRMLKEWNGRNRLHRQICEERGLPADADALDRVRSSSRSAVRECDLAQDALDGVVHQLAAHASLVDYIVGFVEARRDDESRANEAWLTWSDEAATLASIEQNVGADAAAAGQALKEATEELRRTRVVRGDVRALRDGLIGDVSSAETEARIAREAIEGTVDRLHKAGERLRRVVGLTGIAQTAFITDPGDLAALEIQPGPVKAAVNRLFGALHEHTTRSDETALGRAQGVLDRELSGVYDIDVRFEDDVRVVLLADATGTVPVAAAAAELARQVVVGDAALTEKEGKVFQEFVLGGVGHELQDRLARADELVEAMNRSLGTIRTSHGIGVKLRWNLDEDADPTIVRLRDLVSLRSEVRTRIQDTELTALLRDRVDRSFALDPSAGYAVHLQAALDYRAWHRMDVLILGPAPGQERRISKRAKLSQGETRFVSYVTLFAAIDAYLSGLPDTRRALRLLLLDDAFAKVDDPTIGELMGLLVRLDIDFVMTGHALWGTYRQVPKLDAYEVRRAEGTAAITTHVHWDGRNRHLRAAGE